MPDIIESVDRALEVMLYLHRTGRETGITKIAADLGLYKSTVYRTLVTLEKRGFVRKNPETDRYWLGNRLFVLGRGVESRMELPKRARPYVRKLCDAYGEPVSIAVLEHDPGDIYRGVVILEEAGGRSAASAPAGIGRSSSCTASAAGKCLLAFSAGVDLSVYEKDHSEQALAALRMELAEIRKLGYAVVYEGSVGRQTCIGVPIFNDKGEAAAAISLSGPAGDLASSDMEERVEAVKRIAREISGSL